MKKCGRGSVCPAQYRGPRHGFVRSNHHSRYAHFCRGFLVPAGAPGLPRAACLVPSMRQTRSIRILICVGVVAPRAADHNLQNTEPLRRRPRRHNSAVPPPAPATFADPPAPVRRPKLRRVSDAMTRAAAPCADHWRDPAAQAGGVATPAWPPLRRRPIASPLRKLRNTTRALLFSAGLSRANLLAIAISIRARTCGNKITWHDENNTHWQRGAPI